MSRPSRPLEVADNASSGLDEAAGRASLMELLRILHRRRRVVLAVAMGVPLVTLLVVLFMPNVYTSRGTLLVEAPDAPVGTELLGQFTNLPGFSSGAPAADVYLAILRSERVATAVAESLGLAGHFKVAAQDPGERTDKMLRILKKRVRFEQPDFVTVHVEATDREPVMAAAIANAFLGQLESANQTLALSRARRTRVMVESALEETRRELEATRVRLEEFQETRGVVALDVQVEATMTLIGTLQGKLLEMEANRDALLSFQHRDSGQLQNLDIQIEGLRKQIDGLMGSVGLKDPAPQDPGEAKSDYLLELDKIPKLTGEYARLRMEMSVQEAKYNVLATRLEQTKIEESQSLPAFDILDRARVPFGKSGPFRKNYVLAALASGIFGSILLALLLEDLDRRFTPEIRRELAGMLPSPVARWLERTGSLGDRG